MLSAFRGSAARALLAPILLFPACLVLLVLLPRQCRSLTSPLPPPPPLFLPSPRGSATRRAIFPVIVSAPAGTGCCGLLLASSSEASSPSSASELLRDELDLEDRFGRWRFLQRLLEREADPEEVNRVLFAVLEGYLLHPRPKYRDTDETGSPELTPKLSDAIENFLDRGAVGRAVRALIPPSPAEGEIDGDSPSPSVDVVELLEELLPDPDEDEDAHKGLWDTVMELHGREAVKQDEMAGEPSWRACCLVARVLINYDFLSRGLI